MEFQKILLIVLTLSGFNVYASSTNTRSVCFKDIPNSPQENFIETNIAKGRVSDAINLKFWRASCWNSAKTKIITELFMTVTPHTLGKSDLFPHVFIFLQGNKQDTKPRPSDENLYIPKTYVFDKQLIDFSKEFTLIIECDYIPSACNHIESIKLNFSTINIETSSGTPLNTVSGLWFDPELSGLGFNLIDAEVGVIATYYGYDRDGAILWLNASNSIKGDIKIGNTYTLNMNQPTRGNGADFNTRPTTAASGTEAWGTLELTFSSCTEGIALLTGNDGSQLFNLVKLAGNKGGMCN